MVIFYFVNCVKLRPKSVLVSNNFVTTAKHKSCLARFTFTVNRQRLLFERVFSDILLLQHFISFTWGNTEGSLHWLAAADSPQQCEGVSALLQLKSSYGCYSPARHTRGTLPHQGGIKREQFTGRKGEDGSLLPIHTFWLSPQTKDNENEINIAPPIAHGPTPTEGRTNSYSFGCPPGSKPTLSKDTAATHNPAYPMPLQGRSQRGSAQPVDNHEEREGPPTGWKEAIAPFLLDFFNPSLPATMCCLSSNK